MATFNELHTSDAQPWDWDSTSLHLLGRCARAIIPHCLAANKMDIAPKGVVEAFSGRSMRVADMELALRRASSAGLIDYRSGQPRFEVQAEATSTRPRKPSIMQERLQAAGGTGLANLMDEVLFDRLNHMVVYPCRTKRIGWTATDAFPMLWSCLGSSRQGPAGRAYTDLRGRFHPRC